MILYNFTIFTEIGRNVTHTAVYLFVSGEVNTHYLPVLLRYFRSRFSFFFKCLKKMVKRLKINELALSVEE
jgi:hypothetical protein